MAQHAPTVDRIDGDVFLITAFDGDEAAEIRERELAGHLEYMEIHCDRYLVAGPLREPGTEPLVGSFFLVSAENADDARRLVAGDPYVENGLYREINVHSAVPAAGRFMGGVIWEDVESVRRSGILTCRVCC